MIEVKICGITKGFEIDYLNILKPNYIGFVFSKSKRRVSKEEVKKLINKLDSSIKVVAVFRNENISYIADVINFTNIEIVQLHGNEDMNYINDLLMTLNKEIKIWKAIEVIDDKSMLKASQYKVSKVLLDSNTPGEGNRINLNYLREVSNLENIFIAGGINKDNIKEVLENIKINGIDVSSGVEEINLEGERYKSFEKMKELIMEVRKYD